MPGNRAAAEQYMLELVQDIDSSGINRKLYVDKFAKMSDAEFEAMMTSFLNDTKNMVVVYPNFGEVNLSVENNLAVAKKHGWSFFKRIVVPANGAKPRHMTPIKQLVLRLNNRRQAQLIEKKISVPDGVGKIDAMTGQVTGSSKGSKISYPETHLLAAAGLDNIAAELLKVKGGDAGAYNAYHTLISRTGEAKLETVEQYATGVESKAALSVLLRGMMLNNTLT